MRLIRGAALAVASVAVTTLVVGGAIASPAWAKKEPTFTCSHLSGSLASATLSGCGGNTGGSGSFPPSALESGSGTITWANGATTNVSISFKQEKSAKGCPSGSTEFQAKGKTTADTTGSAPPGSKVKGKACFTSSDTLVNPTGSTFQI